MTFTFKSNAEKINPKIKQQPAVQMSDLAQAVSFITENQGQIYKRSPKDFLIQLYTLGKSLLEVEKQDYSKYCQILHKIKENRPVYLNTLYIAKNSAVIPEAELRRVSEFSEMLQLTKQASLGLIRLLIRKDLETYNHFMSKLTQIATITNKEQKKLLIKEFKKELGKYMKQEKPSFRGRKLKEITDVNEWIKKFYAAGVKLYQIAETCNFDLNNLPFEMEEKLLICKDYLDKVIEKIYTSCSMNPVTYEQSDDSKTAEESKSNRMNENELFDDNYDNNEDYGMGYPEQDEEDDNIDTTDDDISE